MTRHDHRWWERIQFDFNPNIGQAGGGEILVGLGNSQDLGQEGVVLNSKYPDSPFRSISRYVLAAETTTRVHWKSRFPAGAADVRRVVLEDLSFDSCFALLLFMEWLNHDFMESSARHEEQWCRHVTRWEEGYTRSQRPWSESIAYLVTTLGHSYFDTEESGRRMIIDPAEFENGARACLELISAAFAMGVSPESIDIGRLECSDAFLRARSHIEYEHSQYLLALQHGKRCQLSVPLRGSGRQMIVDALFIEERDPSGLLKMFARGDRENSWTKRGFDVLGVYRPREAGTGGDMAISVAPESGLTLSALWDELERLEWKRWGRERPHDDPRDIASYKTKKESARPSNQPWWDDYGKYSLIAAPKKVRANGHDVAGTRLGWYRDVLPAVWKCYSPIPEACISREERPPSGSKKLWFCKWSDAAAPGGIEATHRRTQAGAPVSLAADCPTFRGWLKTLSSHGRPIRSPMNVPSEASYEVLDVDGGFLVVHRDGATAFEDWTGTKLEIEAIEAVFHDMAQAWDSLMAFYASKSLAQALDYQKGLLEHGAKFDHAAFEKWKKDFCHSRAKALKVGVSVLNHADPWPLNKFRARLGKLWGFDQHRHEMLDAVDRIGRVTSEIADHRREYRTKWLQALGAGLALGILAKELIETLRWGFVDNPYTWLLKLFGQDVSGGTVNQIAQQLHHWEQATIVFLLGGFIAGIAAYLKFGAKISEH